MPPDQPEKLRVPINASSTVAELKAKIHAIYKQAEIGRQIVVLHGNLLKVQRLLSEGIAFFRTRML